MIDCVVIGECGHVDDEHDDHGECTVDECSCFFS